MRKFIILNIWEIQIKMGAVLSSYINRFHSIEQSKTIQRRLKSENAWTSVKITLVSTTNSIESEDIMASDFLTKENTANYKVSVKRYGDTYYYEFNNFSTATDLYNKLCLAAALDAWSLFDEEVDKLKKQEVKWAGE